MKTYYGRTFNGQAQINWEQVHKDAESHARFVITVDEYNEEKDISRKQMAYLHSVVFPKFAKAYNCSLLWAEVTLKRSCGEQWMVKRIGDVEVILSKTILSTIQCAKWIENVIDWCSSQNIHIPEPDEEWRKNRTNG